MNPRVALAFAREALASARSQKASTALVAVVLAGMCVAVFLTSGRSVATQDAVLSHIDDAATRTVVLRSAQDGSGLDTGVLDRLRHVRSVESVLGLGPTVDVTNAGIPHGTKVAVRVAYGTFGDRPLVPQVPGVGDQALLSTDASYQLGLSGRAVGAVTRGDGTAVPVVGPVDVPGYLAFLEPVALVPRVEPDASAAPVPLSMIVVQVASGAEVPVVAKLATDYAAPLDPKALTVQTSDQLADIRSAIAGDLGGSARGTILGIVAVCAALVAANLFGLVMMRRKDFGRRRALGATRSFVVALLLTQVVLVAVAAVVVGTGVSLAVLAAQGRQYVPSATFVGAIATLAVLTAAVSSVLPALFAARRDPLRELRVP